METTSLIEENRTALSKGYLIALVGTVLWSSTAVFIRYLTERYAMPPLLVAFWRDLFVALILAGTFLLFSPGRLLAGRRNWPFLALYGLVLSLFNSLWTWSVALNGASVSTVLAYSSAGFTAVLGWRFFGERLDWVKGTAVVLSLAGCALVSGAYDPGAWRLNPVGVVTGLLSGVAFAAYSLMGKAASGRGIPPWTTLLYAFGCAALFLGLFNLGSGWLPGGTSPAGFFWLESDLAAWGVLALLAIWPTIGGYGLYTVSLTYLPASVANLIATLEPALTALQAYFFLSERLTLPQLLGSAAIVAGVILLRLKVES